MSLRNHGQFSVAWFHFEPKNSILEKHTPGIPFFQRNISCWRSNFEKQVAKKKFKTCNGVCEIATAEDELGFDIVYFEASRSHFLMLWTKRTIFRSRRPCWRNFLDEPDSCCGACETIYQYKEIGALALYL